MATNNRTEEKTVDEHGEENGGRYTSKRVIQKSSPPAGEKKPKGAPEEGVLIAGEGEGNGAAVAVSPGDDKQASENGSGKVTVVKKRKGDEKKKINFTKLNINDLANMTISRTFSRLAHCTSRTPGLQPTSPSPAFARSGPQPNPDLSGHCRPALCRA